MTSYDIVIIGGGPAGLAAAVGAHGAGIRRILILERDEFLGGILNQCIHNGFGLHTFKQELTGPEYAERYIDKIKELSIEYMTDTMVIGIDNSKRVTAVNGTKGLLEIQAKAVILACGCRERPRGATDVAGIRGAGIYTAGAAQKYANMSGYMVGKKVVIFGSGDIGLIMARRMRFEGAEVVAVIERKAYSSGLNRNIVQCLDDFDIPLLYKHTVLSVNGADRVTGVTIAEVDNKKPIEGTEREVECDTLLLSVGLIPENELGKRAGIVLSGDTSGAVVDSNYMTSVDGIFSCGNVLHVHDIVDFVSEESEIAGRSAAAYVLGGLKNSGKIAVTCGPGIKYALPQFILRDSDGKVSLKFRTDGIYKDSAVSLYGSGGKIAGSYKRIMTPSEMENFVITEELLLQIKDMEEIVIAVEEV